jgi:predicted cation transporter
MIVNNFLNEAAKAFNNESFVLPNYYAYSSSLASVAVTDTVLSGEFGTRNVNTKSRVDNIVTMVAVKTGALASSTGDTIAGVALLSASSGGTLMTELTVPSFLHTTSFDVEWTTSITFDRSA